MAYYIMDTILYYFVRMADVAPKTMLKFVKVGGVVLLLIMKKSNWVLAALIRFFSALMEFSPRLRDYLCAKTSGLFGWEILFLCEKLPESMRRHLHSLGIWVEKLKFSNPIQSRVSKKEICALIWEGAKVHILVPWLTY
jgi:hypothetical protein